MPSCYTQYYVQTASYLAQISQSLKLVSNHSAQPIHLPLKIPMLANTIRISINKLLSPLNHINRLPKTLRLRSPNRHNPIALNHIPTPLRRKAHPLDIARQFNELNTLARGTNGFEMPESFANPVHDPTLLFESGDVRATRDEDGVEHRGAHALEVVIWLDAFAGVFAFAVCVYDLAFRADDEGEGFCGFEGGDDAVESDGIVAVSD